MTKQKPEYFYLVIHNNEFFKYPTFWSVPDLPYERIDIFEFRYLFINYYYYDDLDL